MQESVSLFLHCWTAERTSAVANIGLLFTAIVSAIVALRSMKQSRDIEHRANRPMMIAEVVPPTDRREEVGLRIANLGRSVAKDVQVKFDPELPEPDLDALNRRVRPGTQYSSTNIEEVLAIFDDRTFKTWTPGMEVTAQYWAVPKDFDRSNVGDSAEGVPPRQGVKIAYKDEIGCRYEEEFVLDVHTVLGLRFAKSEAQKHQEAIVGLSQELKSIAAAAHEIARCVRYDSEEPAAGNRRTSASYSGALDSLKTLESGGETDLEPGSEPPVSV